jgi:hypothetical protein
MPLDALVWLIVAVAAAFNSMEPHVAVVSPRPVCMLNSMEFHPWRHAVAVASMYSMDLEFAMPLNGDALRALVWLIVALVAFDTLATNGVEWSRRPSIHWQGMVSSTESSSLEIVTICEWRH